MRIKYDMAAVDEKCKSRGEQPCEFASNSSDVVPSESSVTVKEPAELGQLVPAELGQLVPAE